MLRYSLSALFLFYAMLLFPYNIHAAAAADINVNNNGSNIGTIKTAVQAAWIVRAGVEHIANTGNVVFAADILKTGDNGAIGVLFRDDTLISIGANSEYHLDDYVYQPKEGRFSFLSTIVSGTLEFISGKITKMSPEAVAVKTPTGTIGIRGTHFLVKVDAAASQHEAIPTTIPPAKK